MMEIDVFARNRAFWGMERQELLAGKSLFVAGMGALGCVVSEILVRSGIGEIVIADRGIVDPPDLNRQTLYTLNELGDSKVDCAANRLRILTGQTRVVPAKVSIGDDDVAGLIAGCDGVADCLDNFPSRFALEDALPGGAFMVSGGLLGDYGQLTTILPGRTARLKDLFTRPGATEKTIPVTPPIVFAVGSFMAQEILDNLRGKPQLAGEILAVGMSCIFTDRVPTGSP
jgi:adenylyltransferase/sulfurtransferase